MFNYSIVFKFFAEALNKAPNKELLASIGEHGLMNEWPIERQNQDAKDGLKDLQSFFKKYSETDFSEVSLEIEKDFFSLFEMSPPKVYTNESVWLGKEKLLFEEETFKVRTFFAKYGLQAATTTGPDDHLSLELLFVAHLIDLVEESPEKKSEVYEDIHSFMTEHLMKWGVSCFTQIASESNTEFYSSLGRLAAGTLVDFNTLEIT